MLSGYTPRETLELMLGHLGFVFEIEEQQRPAGPALNILTRDPGRLIGRNGKTIEDLQYLLNRILGGHEDAHQRVVIDVENYRLQQNQDFLNDIKASIETVRSTGTEIVLPPMNSFDRRQVHNLCVNDPDVESYSPKDDSRLKKITLRPRTKPTPAP